MQQRSNITFDESAPAERTPLDVKRGRYVALCHAMQTGVGFKMTVEPDDTSSKHLRVGVNIAMREHQALATLLMNKGVFTEDEYWDALIEQMQAEVDMYEATLAELYDTEGGRIKLV